MAHARNKAIDRGGFYRNLIAYVVVNVLLIEVWWSSGDRLPWFVFVLVPWGIGVVINGARVFVRTGVTDKMAL